MFPVNPTTVLTFLTWFGGAGFILRNYYGVVALTSLATRPSWAWSAHGGLRVPAEVHPAGQTVMRAG